MKTPPTLQDVADRAGVSRMTVSYALRSHPSIPAATRQRVVDAAESIGYRRNALVSALMAQRSHGNPPVTSVTTLAVLLRRASMGAKADDAFVPGVRARAEQRGFKVEYFYLNVDGMTEERLNKVLRARGIWGLIIPRMGELTTLNLMWEGFAAVTQGYTLVAPEIHRVHADLYDDALLAIEKLRELGYRRIGLAIPENSSRQTLDKWLAAFCVRERDWKRQEHVPPLLFDWQRWERQLQTWYNQHRPDVILHSHVHMEPVLRRMGFDVPRDVGLAHLDQSMFSEEHGPGMAGIDQNWSEVGAAMVDAVIAQMLANERGIPEHPRTVQIKGHWVDGISVARREQVIG